MVDLANADAVIALFEQAAGAMRDSSLRDHCVVRLPARGRLLATGDLHDNPINFRKVVHAARLDASPDNHLVLHELIHGENLLNGMDFSHRMLAKVAELVTRYPLQAHPMLANHELSQMTDTGVSKGAGNSVELFDESLRYVYQDRWHDVAGAIDVFIAALPLAIISASGVLCAHSLPAPGRMKHFDMQVLARDLEPADYLGPNGAAYLMTWGRSHTAEQTAQLAQAWNVKLFCLGHQHVESGIEMRDERTIILNSDHQQGAVLPIDLANPFSAEEAIMHALPLASIPEPG